MQGVGMEGLRRSCESIHKRGAFQVQGTKCNVTRTCTLSWNCAVPTVFLPVMPGSRGWGYRGEGWARNSSSTQSRQCRAQPYPCHSSAQGGDPGESCTNTDDVAQDQKNGIERGGVLCAYGHPHLHTHVLFGFIHILMGMCSAQWSANNLAGSQERNGYVQQVAS